MNISVSFGRQIARIRIQRARAHRQRENRLCTPALRSTFHPFSFSSASIFSVVTRSSCFSQSVSPYIPAPRFASLSLALWARTSAVKWSVAEIAPPSELSCRCSSPESVPF